jgi:hypothetical protein
MNEIIIIFLLVIVGFLFYRQENTEKKYEEKINKILANNPNLTQLIRDEKSITKQWAELRMQDPLLAPEVRGPFPIVKINQNPRLEYTSDPEYLTYQQVGFLINNDDDDKPIILSLFGKKKYPRGDQWEYYYQTDKYNQIKIPIQYKKNYALMSKDIINIPEYKKDFTVTIYEYDSPKYIPYII